MIPVIEMNFSIYNIFFAQSILTCLLSIISDLSISSIKDIIFVVKFDSSCLNFISIEEGKGDLSNSVSIYFSSGN